MNRIDRLSAILILLQTRRIVPAREIAERYGISLRTVYRDIRALEEAGVPVGAEPGKGYFLAEGYHLPPVMFTPDEAGALLLGAKLVEKFSDRSTNQHFAGALDKIKAVLGQADQDYLNQLDALVTVLSIAPRDREPLPGNLLIAIQSMLAESRVVHIDYHSNSKDEVTRRAVEPLGLCFYAGNWHLLAYCHLRRQYRDFRVDRIQSIEPAGEWFDRGRHADLDQLVRQIVLPAELMPAVLRFTPHVARMIHNQKYFFGFVRQYEQDDGIVMEFLVPDYDYLARWLLSLVDQATVISPARLERIIAGFVRQLSTHYAPMQEN